MNSRDAAYEESFQALIEATAAEAAANEAQQKTEAISPVVNGTETGNAEEATAEVNSSSRKKRKRAEDDG